MKIVNLSVSNIKRIKAIQIKPDGNIIQITGRNAQGKSSLLDAIWWALKGKGAVQSDPIRHGEDKASITMDLGEYVISRYFSTKGDGEYTTSLKVMAADGSLLASPQSVIDALYGNLSFDPLNFMKMRPKEQMQYLKEFVEGIDFDAIDIAHRIDYDERQDINRDEKKAIINAEAIFIPDGFNEERVEVDKLFTEIREADAHNASIATRQSNRETLAGAIATKEQLAEDKAKQVADLRVRASELDNEVHHLLSEITGDKERLANADVLPEEIDVAEIQERMDNAKTINDTVDLVEKRAELFKEAEELKTKSDALTKSIDNRKAETKKAIKAIDMPVDGLDFGEDCILYNDVPFNQASDAEQLTVSIQMGMAMNPDLRVLRVRDGSLLDKASMELLTEMADTHDYQFWVERVSDDDSVGIVIEDGSVKK